MKLNDVSKGDRLNSVDSNRWTSALKYAPVLLVMAFGMTRAAMASTAYGSLNNFDCVNDTGEDAHGFEIELDDCKSTDITYTYDYNHYGTPRIYEDLSVPGHPKVFIRYESKKNPDGTWAAKTIVPTGPIAPTMGHQFTDPSVNFGGEHFGVGFAANPSSVKNNWLLDDGTGNLVHGPAVNISTPSYVYVPPVGNKPAAVVAVIEPPEPPEVPHLEFGDASWVKEIKTTTHNSHKVKLNELVGDDPGKAQPWANGEPAEVEMEWKVMQTDFKKANGGKNGQLKGGAEKLPKGNEMVTRRYEFYKYVGPVDAESGEAMGDTVAKDGIHGVGIVTYNDHIDPATGEWVTVTTDLSKVIIVGDFFGTQMVGFDVAPALGLIDHVADLDVNVALAPRSVVIGGTVAFQSKIAAGALPTGLTFDPVTGVLSGTPTATGTYSFTIEATDLSGAVVTKAYTVNVLGAAPAMFNITAAAMPADGGIITGAGTFDDGTKDTLFARAKKGFEFLNWSEAGNVVSTLPRYSFNVSSDRDLVANFSKLCVIATRALPAVGGSTAGDGTFSAGKSVTVTATPNAGYVFDKWTLGRTVASLSPSYTFTTTGSTILVANFAATYTITSSALPLAGGSTSGDGTYKNGTRTTLVAKAAVGYKFANWTENGTVLSTAPRYLLTVNANHAIQANFLRK